MNVYEIITNKIMTLLEEGTIPWQKPWKAAGGAKNLISKKPYRGINQFLLNCSPYSSPYWLTFNQARQKGGQVRKGEKSTLVVFWKWIERKKDDDQESGSSHPGIVPLLRNYNVFNLDQIDGITAPEEEQSINPFAPIEQAELLMQNMPNKPVI